MYCANFQVVLLAAIGLQVASPATQPVQTQPHGDATAPAARGQPVVPRFTARFAPPDIKVFVQSHPDKLPLFLQSEYHRQAILDTLDHIDMGELLRLVEPDLKSTFSDRFDPKRDLLIVPVPPDRQVEVPAPALEGGVYRGPAEEVTGFLLHDITEAEYLSTVIRLIQRARQCLDTGDPIYDRTAPDHLRKLAEREAARQSETRAAEDAARRQREEVRRRIGAALGVYDPETGQFNGPPEWLKESRRFTYVVQNGQFIDRLKPTVDRINAELEMAGFPPPSVHDRPGIRFDSDLQDVEIVLPRSMMREFLEEADRLERRMAEEHIISIEAVRLTDRDIISGALASRLNAQVQGVHDVKRYNVEGVFRQLGLNALLAVANQQLQVATLNSIEAGKLPEGVSPVQIASPDLPPIRLNRDATTVGSTFSVGADDIFFDGREQSYGFSYIGPDGLKHTLAVEVVDSLREFWDRIERNLIVHKIKRTGETIPFTVPVGPANRTFPGIAALVSQENQQLVVATGTGAISEISATAGTWLIIQDFQIAPLPGSSTTLTEDERKLIHDKVLLTMFLRDPATAVESKCALLEARTPEQLTELLAALLREKADQQIHPEFLAPTYQEVFRRRLEEVTECAAVEKKERNSTISLTFFSSQGNIIAQPGVTQLGDSNDLTSFTTELRPNVVTPISSFFTKSGSGAKGSSPLTGVAKGEQTNEEKTMTHLVIRARFPTLARERMDRDEGRHLGYFELPIGRQAQSLVDLPFLSSSEHPLERLSKLRVGLMFDSLQEERVKKPLSLINPNQLMGTVPARVWETATTRMLMNRKIISDSPHTGSSLAMEYRQRFILQVRSLLEYDEDFFASPNFALRNMAQWNDPDRIVLALDNSPGRFALQRLIILLDELGALLVPDEYADRFLALSMPGPFGQHKLRPLTADELRTLRRDVANHYLRFQEAYGDAFLEAVSMILNLGTYRTVAHAKMLDGPFRGYHDLVVFDCGAEAVAEEELFQAAHGDFLIVRGGGVDGGLFSKSRKYLEDIAPERRAFITRGRDVLERTEWWRPYAPMLP
ncbi:MAG TPA: hypothetical protein PKG54_07035 [Phycisphaerae bacterium]|nr:hypothetical protein [Phycisphaerae bacterium]HOB74263.1 hypothetical protein [Phycisphaerae bacterium]HOJ53146.1 hypothetical protein [Phycisphaerae bacterium]HOL24883.1 hypothetical protein [Phycisphaerae bacterium]HPP19419.1 hypothetical protein [Phycisphaerae bacterium]